MEIEPMASNSRFPVYDVKPRLVAAIKMPAKAALSSSNTATAFGSRPLDTDTKNRRTNKYLISNYNYFELMFPYTVRLGLKNFEMKAYNGYSEGIESVP